MIHLFRAVHRLGFWYIRRESPAHELGRNFPIHDYRLQLFGREYPAHGFSCSNDRFLLLFDGDSGDGRSFALGRRDGGERGIALNDRILLLFFDDDDRNGSARASSSSSSSSSNRI